MSAHHRCPTMSIGAQHSVSGSTTSQALNKAQHSDRTTHAYPRRLHGIMPIMVGRDYRFRPPQHGAKRCSRANGYEPRELVARNGNLNLRCKPSLGRHVWNGRPVGRPSKGITDVDSADLAVLLCNMRRERRAHAYIPSQAYTNDGRARARSKELK
jgi:hypothetical protein